MSGLFEHWQAEYAAHGIATFPVRGDKSPAVKRYLKIGLSGSGLLAIRFPDASGIGLACKRNKITVLDVDSTDERILADGLDQFGATPLVVRTGSGNYQAWYRNNGEDRRIRPNPKVPIDILGDGFVVAPPSIANAGPYRIIAGSLDDLDRLPTMRAQAATAVTPKVANGRRNNELWRHCMTQAHNCLHNGEIERLLRIAMTYNQQTFYEPLPNSEVLKIVASAWSKTLEGDNWFGTGRRIVVEANDLDLLAREPYAVTLMLHLRRHNWRRDFLLSNGLAASLGWTLPRFRNARDRLVESGIIVCIHQGGNGVGDVPRYRWGKVSEITHQ